MLEAILKKLHTRNPLKTVSVTSSQHSTDRVFVLRDFRNRQRLLALWAPIENDDVSQNRRESRLFAFAFAISINARLRDFAHSNSGGFVRVQYE